MPDTLARRDFLRFLAASPLLAGLGRGRSPRAAATSSTPRRRSTSSSWRRSRRRTCRPRTGATSRPASTATPPCAPTAKGSRASPCASGASWACTPPTRPSRSSARPGRRRSSSRPCRASARSTTTARSRRRGPRAQEAPPDPLHALVDRRRGRRRGPRRARLVPALPDGPVVRRAGLMKRAEAAGCPALVLTVDLQGGSNRETVVRGRRADTRDCSSCHVVDPFDVVGALRTGRCSRASTSRR